MIQCLSNKAVSPDFQIVLLKTLRHLIAQLNFRDSTVLASTPELKLIWQDAI